MVALAECPVENYADGTYVVRGLPLISEEFETDARFRNERKTRVFFGGSDKPRDKAWLERCRQNLLWRIRQRSYKPPQLFGHTDGPHEIAGYFVPTDLRQVQVNPDDPRPRWTLHRDVVFKDRAAYERWRDSTRFSSPEVSPDFSSEVDADAFLEHEAPFNKYGTPQIRERFAATKLRYRSRKFATTGQAFRLTRAAPSKQTSAALPAPGKESTMADEKKPDAAPGAKHEGDEAPGWFSKYMAASEHRHNELMECMKSFMGKDEPPAETPPELEKQADEEPVGPASEPAVYASAPELKVLRGEVERMRAADATKDAKIKALETAAKIVDTHLAAMKEREALEARVQKGVKAIEAHGLVVDATLRADLVEAAHEGEKSFDRVVSLMKRLPQAGPDIEPSGFAAADAGDALDDSVDAVPTEIEDMRKRGGKFAATANEKYSAWKALTPSQRKHLFGDDISLFLYDSGPQGQKLLPSRRNGRG